MNHKFENFRTTFNRIKSEEELVEGKQFSNVLTIIFNLSFTLLLTMQYLSVDFIEDKSFIKEDASKKSEYIAQF